MAESDGSSASKSEPSTFFSTNKDTLLIAEVDTMIEDIYKMLRAGAEPLETTMEFNGQAKNLSYYELPGGYSRWDAKFSPEGFERYVTFFLKDEEVIKFRFREWNMQQNLGAGEVMVYLKNGKIFYAKERTMALGVGQTPALLIDKPHNDSKRSKKELRNLMETYYPSMKAAWDKRND